MKIADEVDVVDGGRRISRYHETILERYRRYGPIYCETIAGETDVHLVSPDYVQTVYKNEGKMPYIVSLLETSELYRRLRQMSPGLGHVCVIPVYTSEFVCLYRASALKSSLKSGARPRESAQYKSSHSL